jgi:hypothetical protein
MLISVVNHTDGKLSDEAVQEGIRAVNRQIAEDFNPNWSMGAELRLEGAIGKDPDDDKLPELRGDAIIYLWNEVDVEDALGYHEANAAGIPFGFVFTELVKQLKEPWTVTFSHEALELIGDPEANFVLPLYFTQFAEVGGRNDFLGRLTKGKALQSFGINPGGYIGFYNPKTREHETFSLKGDRRARERQKIKGKGQLTRRSVRYKLGTEFRKQLEAMTAGVPRRRARPARRPPERRAVEMIDRSPLRPGLGAD